MRPASQGTDGACRPSRGSISSACHGCRGADHPSSGASGMTPGTWPTTFRPSAATSTTAPCAGNRPGTHDRRAEPELTAQSPSARTERQMAHTRIRKFNTRDTYPDQRLDNDLCQAVVARGRMVFLRGQCPQDLDTAANIGSHD